MQIRSTSSADLPLLPAIEHSAAQAFRQFPQWRWLADGAVMTEAEHARLAALQTSWVAVQGDAPCGFICAETFATQAGRRELHIWELSVHAKMQGKGVGSALMRHAMAFVEADPTCEGITLTTFRTVPFNAPFYTRLGFALLGEDELDDRLSHLLSREIAQGLDARSRCAMRWTAQH